MRLFQHEMKKLLLNKKSLILLAVLFVFYLIAGMGNSTRTFGSAANYQVFAKLASAAAGEHSDTQAQASNDAYDEAAARYGTDGVAYIAMGDPTLDFNLQYHKYDTAVTEYQKGAAADDPAVPYGITQVQARLAELEKSGQTNTYLYKKLSSQLSTSLKLGAPSFANTQLWDIVYSSLSFMIIIVLFMPLAFFAAPVFTTEAATGMDNIILSSKNGQKKIVLAKLGAVTVTSALLAFLYLTATFIGNFLPFMTLDGIGASIRSMNSLVRASFEMTIGQFALLTYVWTILIAIGFGLIMTLISSKMKSRTGAFAIGIALLLGNMLLESLGKNLTALKAPLKFGFLKIADVTSVFGGVTTFNVFGMVIPYWLAALGVVVIVSALVVALTFHAQKHRAIAK